MKIRTSDYACPCFLQNVENQQKNELPFRLFYVEILARFLSFFVSCLYTKYSIINTIPMGFYLTLLRISFGTCSELLRISFGSDRTRSEQDAIKIQWNSLGIPKQTLSFFD